MEKRINKLEAAIEHAAGVKERAELALLSARQDLDELKKQELVYKKAMVALQAASNQARRGICRRLEKLVTSALQSIYGQGFKFSIELSADRLGRLSATFYVESNGVKNEPLEFRGGGVVDVISIILRLGMAALIQEPPPVGPLLLDEPGRHLDKESAAKLGEFLRTLAESSNRQVIVVTHHDEIASYADPGGSFRITQEGGTSIVCTAEAESFGHRPTTEVVGLR